VRADLAASTKESARFDVAFEAAEAGAKVISAEARFVICQETACKPVKETLALNIEVGAAAPAPRARRRRRPRRLTPADGGAPRVRAGPSAKVVTIFETFFVSDALIDPTTRR